MKTNDSTNELYWTCLKVSMIYVWLPYMIQLILPFRACPFPVGICRVYDFNVFFSQIGSVVLICSLVVLSIAYLFERYMLLVTALLAALSCIIISHHESNGIFYRATAYTTIWVAQFLAYLLAKLGRDFDGKYYRQQFVVQIIAATYTLAAISKLSASGLAWVSDGADFFAVHILKGFSFMYSDTGDPAVMQQGYMMAGSLIAHKHLVSFLLASSLLLETFCMAAVLQPSIRIKYGIALVCMHIGISYYMNIYISGMADPMVIFFINPLYYLVLGYKYLRMKYAARGHAA